MNKRLEDGDVKVCQVEGCEKPHKARGLCASHYGVAQRTASLPPQRTIADRFWAKVDKSGPCWTWTATRTRDGYGFFWSAGRMVLAHRWAYEDQRGPIQPGLELDHLCRTRSCVRPDHLEAVTYYENQRRGVNTGISRSFATHCQRGHERTPENTYVTAHGYRNCRACVRANHRQWRQKARARGAA